MFEGTGTSLLPDGLKYDGEFSKGLKEGKGILDSFRLFFFLFLSLSVGLILILFRFLSAGTLIDSNGERYEGLWKDNQREVQTI